MKGIVGIVGGGQLGRMLTEAAIPMGYKVVVLDPTPNCPAAQVGAKQIVASLSDEEKIRELAKSCDFLTWEIEHINTKILEQLAKDGFSINPSPKTLSLIKDKLSQSDFLKKLAIPTADFHKVDSKQDLLDAVNQFGYPLMLKSRFGGYDGRGNFVINDESEIDLAFKKLGSNNLYAQKFIEFEKELAVMAARDIKGNVLTYPVVENIHKNNILHFTLVPAQISAEQTKKAEDLAKKVLSHLDGAGVFGIEMFLDKKGEILINEIAPRVHNSGHYTIESCVTSQFEQHIRAITKMELGETKMTTNAAVMVNLLGERNGEAKVKGVDQALTLGEVFVHIYGKKDSKLERKMGHITVLGDILKDTLAKAKKAQSYITI